MSLNEIKKAAFNLWVYNLNGVAVPMAVDVVPSYYCYIIQIPCFIRIWLCNPSVQEMRKF